MMNWLMNLSPDTFACRTLCRSCVHPLIGLIQHCLL
jgi:hypothetical protein